MFSGRLTGQEQEYIAGPAGPAAGLSTIEEFWAVLFTDEIIQIAVDNTNDQIETKCSSMIEDNLVLQSYHHHTDMMEMKAFIGLLYYSGAWKSSNVDVHHLWEKENGLSLYRCVMCRNRFSFLCMCLRFDDKTKRDVNDKLAPIRKIWSLFIQNCQMCYNPDLKMTVDEQLLSFRGRCSFRMYMKAKPDKYGLKVVTLNDATTSYLYHAIPYLGKVTLEGQLSGETIPEYYFRKVTEPIHGTHRTVTCDNWFTTIPMLDRFVDEPYALSITGTVRKNKKEVPAEFKVASKTVPDTKFCFSRNNILLSHTPKKNRIVLVASSYTKSTDIVNGKPQVIQHYNKTKGGTDTFDQLCHAYTVTKRTNRWPMRYFFGMLDQAAVNARILLTCSNANKNSKEKTSAKDCLQKLALHLVRPLLRTRINNPTLRRDIRLGISGILNENETSEDSEERIYLSKKQRCGLCTRAKDRKTKEKCPVCIRPMCDEHRAYICVDCAGEE